MGQQQLLLLVLGIVIVALTVVTGFQVFEVKMRQSAVDQLTDRNLTIASDAIFWKTKKDPYAGGNASYTNLTFQAMALKETTSSGRFGITRADDDKLEITAVSERYPEIGVRTFVTGHEIDSTTVMHDGTITLN